MRGNERSGAQAGDSPTEWLLIPMRGNETLPDQPSLQVRRVTDPHEG